jgi:DNA-3-methyladenine glycosylase
MKKKLSRNFYTNQDVLAISKALLGKFLVTKLNANTITAGMIVETEAYRGSEDKASHAYGNKRTTRTETMYMSGGHAYVYLCYGMHHLFNIVTAIKDLPHAVLIRAIEPIDGIDLMLKRRKLATLSPKLTAGPGSLTKALGITTLHDTVDLCGEKIWIEDRNIQIKASNIVPGPRVGVAYAQEHAQLPWRFKIKDNPWVSPAK